MTKLKKIELALSKNKISGAKALLTEMYLAEDKQAFNKVLSDEYELLYNFEEEYVVTEMNDEGEDVEVTKTRTVKELTAPTFNEYVAETKVVTESVEATYDEQGLELTPFVTEVVEEIRPYVALEVAARVDLYIKNATMPKSVTARQCRLALLQIGKLSMVKDAIENGTDEALKIEWEYATKVSRNWNSLIELTTALGISKDELDDLFILAGSIK